MPSPPRAVIFACEGPVLTDGERGLFADADPLGFILFDRNVDNPGQVRALIDDLRATVGRGDAPVLIDQEGGRVERLHPPHWRHAPPPAVFAGLDDTDPDAAVEAAGLNARLIADELAALGITVDCIPVLDIPQAGSHPVIGDRAAGRTPEQAARLGRATCEGLMAGGVLPVIKHIPGHGRATADSHKELPVVEAPLAELEATDFAPFRALNDIPWGMTAHVVYTALDPDDAASVSRTVLDGAVRGAIGFDGLLVSDDIGMEALTGTPAERAVRCVEAGCDAVLHCSGTFAEMQAVAAACPAMSDAAVERFRRAEARRGAAEPFDRARAEARLAALLGDAAPD